MKEMKRFGLDKHTHTHDEHTTRAWRIKYNTILVEKLSCLPQLCEVREVVRDFYSSFRIDSYVYISEGKIL